jgi:chromatin segregation and condensation protein Rec8/ScpA/Scc1 (kleisin family)
LKKLLKKSFNLLKEPNAVVKSENDIEVPKQNLIYEVSQSDRGSFSIDKLRNQEELKSEFFEKMGLEFDDDCNLYLPWTKNEIINAIQEIIDISRIYQ